MKTNIFIIKNDLPYYREEKPHFIKRIIWRFINVTIFRILISYQLRYLRNLLLRAFGAKIPLYSMVYNTCDIFAPWNLVIGKHSCIGPNTRIYNKDKIIIGEHCVISQNAYLCTASHNINDLNHTLITAPIILRNRVWIASDAFVGMGVTIGEGAVVGARGCVFKDVEPWTVVGGNPAKFIKKRIIKE
ncbi:MAG TPA: putative colanic acid biosynthesis acetyltransferase [Bacteroides clarus]|jgi:putative colanic acid biosynthesis acetyltransferase WcaF|uniref:putative colanic acid biosynthesis acetyltransferase n=1 Tax=Bacteroides clarus TaxID=626929 RepID=UPI0018AA34DD|nr:putative colanic acid biosynthesis acetyltransferase [Bacteroides clarus]HJF99881.1 putative colanic acid biosynthesis acetyltransferase [Bacteroides clarus]